MFSTSEEKLSGYEVDHNLFAPEKCLHNVIYKPGVQGFSCFLPFCLFKILPFVDLSKQLRRVCDKMFQSFVAN